MSVLIASVLIGCNNTGGPDSSTFPVLICVTEGDSVTEFKYDEDGIRIGESYEYAGKLIHVMDNYRYENNYNSVTADRHLYNDDGTVTEQRVEIDYVRSWEGYQFEREYQVFEGNTLVERRITNYNNAFNMIEYTHTKGGEVLVHRHDYDYITMEGTENPYFRYKESKNGGEELQMGQYGTKILTHPNNGNRTIQEYEIYAGWNSFLEKGTLVEKVTDFRETSTLTTYKITRYDADGTNPVEIPVEKEWKIITINY